MAKEKELSNKNDLNDVHDPEIEVISQKKESVDAYAEDLSGVDDQPKQRKSNASVPVDKFDWDAFEKDAVYDTD
ncbi:MAG TPA: hypothetical protein PKM89_01555, partial [Bacteroidales bacterium]|nr:hypothetical protein [Bacteroidales bacterium]